MKKKVLIKWIIGCGMLCMMLLVLWKRTHINYDEYSDKTSDMQHEEVEEKWNTLSVYEMFFFI